MTEIIMQFTSDVAAAREQACEAMLQSGGYGVLEVWESPTKVTFELSASVPYGQIHVRPWIACDAR